MVIEDLAAKRGRWVEATTASRALIRTPPLRATMGRPHLRRATLRDTRPPITMMVSIMSVRPHRLSMKVNIVIATLAPSSALSALAWR
jgi:hypothetical protein